MKANWKVEKELLSCPGDTILETIEILRISQADLAKRMGLTPSKINDIIKGKEPISLKTAILLERVLNIEAQFWINRENIYREKLMRIEQQEYFDNCIVWLKSIPVNFLKKLNYIESHLKGNELVQQVLQFFRVASPKEWEKIYVLQYANTNYRKSAKHSETLGSIATWLRLGEIEMGKAKLTNYDKPKFLEILEHAKQLIPDSDSNYTNKLKELCKEAGVELVYTPNIPKAPVSGATRWIGKNPLIQLTDRFKTNDHFWFSFFHEAGHIVKHGKTEVFIEDFEEFKLDNAKEEEANQFAQKMLINKQLFSDLADNYSEINIKKVAQKHKTHPGIIVGRLQHDKKIPYTQLNQLKDKVKLFND